MNTLLSLMIPLALVGIANLKPPGLIKVKKLPKQCEGSYIYDPGNTKPYLKCICIFETLHQKESLSFLQELNIKSLFVRWFCHSKAELDDGVFSKMQTLEKLDIGGCFKINITHSFFRGLDNVRSLRISADRLYAPNFGSDWLVPLKRLQQLTLVSDHIASFPSESFCGARELLILDIRSNGLNDSESLGIKCVGYKEEIESCHPCLPNLLSLDLSGNFISVLNLSFSADLPRLKNITMKNSNLSELIGIDSKSIMTMTDIDLRNNHLSSFTIKDIEKCNGSRLKTLKLSRNQLRFISVGLFSCTDQLRELDLAGNNLSVEHLMVSGITELRMLRYLNISHSKIDILQSTFIGNFTNLVELSCTNCGIRIIESGAFFYLHKLQTLRLNNNGLTSINDDMFLNNTILFILDLRDNNLFSFEVSQGIRSLVHLDLSGNELQELPDFTGSWSNLTVLDLSRNNISEKGLDRLSDLSHLENMNLSFNSVRSVPAYTFWGLTKLVTLDVSNNVIGSLGYHSFIGLFELSELKIQYNQISNLNKSLLPLLSLRQVHIHRNLITTLDDENFKQTSLQWIDISWNQVSHIDPFFLQKNDLNFINLTFNKMHYLDMDSLKISPGKKPRPQVLLQGNLLHCNCHNDIIPITYSDM